MKGGYGCRGECGARPGTKACLIHQARKLIEEAAEFLEALANQDEEAIKAEWRDVEKIIDGILLYHPWLAYGRRQQ